MSTGLHNPSSVCYQLHYSVAALAPELLSLNVSKISKVSARGSLMSEFHPGGIPATSVRVPADFPRIR